MSGCVGIICGTAVSSSEIFDGVEKKKIKTPYGVVNALVSDTFNIIHRHDFGKIPPHTINHRANIYALKQLCDTAVGLSSVGSLKRDIDVGSIVVPSDYMNFHPVTFFDEEIVHIVPSFDENVRDNILDATKKAGVDALRKAVYFQSRGPRLETKAEVKMLSRFADVVGMTVASEATLANEIGLPYAALCCVDNMAHGMEDEVLDFDSIKAVSKKNSEKIIGITKHLIR